MKRVEMPISALKETKDNMLIFEFEEKPTMEEILEECKKHYPIGTLVKCLQDGRGIIKCNYRIVSNRIYADSEQEGICLYFNGKYAEIIKPASKVETPKFKEGDFVQSSNTKFHYMVFTKFYPCDRTLSIEVANKGEYIPSTKEEFEAQLAKENLKFNYEELKTEPLKYTPKVGDCFKVICNGTDTIHYGITKRIHENKVVCHIAIGRTITLEDYYDKDASYNFIKIEQSEIKEALVKFNKKWNFETNTLEDLDEFAHLPQKIEDLYRMETPLITSPSKYAKAIQVQHQLLKLYEAWKDEVDFKYSDITKNKWCINLINNNLIISGSIDRNYLFAFKTQKKAERFLELFRAELEQYKPLMGGQ